MPEDPSRSGTTEPPEDADESTESDVDSADVDPADEDRRAGGQDASSPGEGPATGDAPSPGADDSPAGDGAVEDTPVEDTPVDDETEIDAQDAGHERPSGDDAGGAEPTTGTASVPADVRKYDRFKKMDGAQYERVNEFLRDRTYITAREWAIARLCADFRTETGVEMTKIGENLPRLVPFMTDEYSAQAVNQARSSFESKVRKSGATFLYGAMSEFLTADELDDLMYEATEVAKFLLEVEGVELTVEEELEAEDRISSVMREVRRSSDELRHEGVECPHCGNEFEPETTETEESAETAVDESAAESAEGAAGPADGTADDGP